MKYEGKMYLVLQRVDQGEFVEATLVVIAGKRHEKLWTRTIRIPPNGHVEFQGLVCQIDTDPGRQRVVCSLETPEENPPPCDHCDGTHSFLDPTQLG